MMGAQHPLSVDPKTALPPVIAMYDELWQRYLAVERAHHAALQKLSDDEAAVTRQGEYGRCFKPVSSHEETEFTKVAGDIVTAVVSLAERTFAAAGASLSIDDRDYKENLTERNDEGFWMVRADFKPSDIWRRLEDRYGGARGEDLAYRQAADAIVESLNLAPGVAVKSFRGGCELEARIWVESDYRGKTVSYSCQDRLRGLAQGLRGFVAWADIGDGPLPQWTIDRWVREFLSAREGFKSRATVSGGGIEFIMFYEKMLVRLSPQLAVKLNEFVSTYAARFSPNHEG